MIMGYDCTQTIIQSTNNGNLKIGVIFGPH